MKSAESQIVGRKTAAVLLFFALTSLPPLQAPAAGQPDSPTALEKTRGKAEAQHEIVVILLKKKEYERAVGEANKIFDMNWPEGQEPLLLKELLILTDLFLKQGQASLGLQIIEKNSNHFKRPASKIEILKETGYLYKSLKQDEKALEYFQKARDLESKN